MTRLALVLVLICPSLASAQLAGFLCLVPPAPKNESFKLGTNGWMEYLVQTWVPPNVCTVQVAVTADVAGLPNSGSGNQYGIWTAIAQKQLPVPSTAWYNTHGNHWYYLPDPFTVVGAYHAGRSISTVEVRVQTDADVCLSQGYEYTWNYSNGTCEQWSGSPLVLARPGVAFRFTSRAAGVWFDLDGDGDRELVSWTAAGVENAWLCFDRNANGKCDNGKELFGTATPVPAVNGGLTSAGNGFDALSYTERVLNTSLPDNKLTLADPMLSRLLLWTDRNHNGISEPSELVLAVTAGLTSIPLTFSTVSQKDAFGNEIRQTATASWRTGAGRVADVWLVTH